MSNKTIKENDQTLKDVKWIPQGFDWVDPLKDQQAQQMAVRNGFKSRSAVVLKVNKKVDVAVNKYLKFVWTYLFTATLGSNFTYEVVLRGAQCY